MPLATQDLPAPRLARTMTIFALLCFAALAITNVTIGGARGPRLAAFVLCILAVFAVQVVNSSSRIRRWALWRRAASLALQAALTYGPAAVFGEVWGGMLGCLAGSTLLLLPKRAGWGAFGLVSLSSLGFGILLEPSVFDIVYVVQSTMLTGFIIYGLTRLADLVAEVHSSRGELARAAVLQERLRFARDLHDLLGYSLSAITLKTELIHRLIGLRPDRAREETTEVLEVSRQALADVRLVASGYRDMSLAAEAESAARTLKAADIQAEVVIDCGRLHPLVDTVLATALREGVTNLLRHSKVQVCTVSAAVTEAETVLLTMVNDGVSEERLDSSPRSGSGIGNLQTRLGAIGGRVTAGVRADGQFELVAEAPMRPENPAPAAEGPEEGCIRSVA
ncbi:sensor histidine kinase [Peterkaempfera sp. SMS 1(5)a]|uniref:sensor histidine kinase n=1 Tax=Peterkaempfera podocarpi TaxID=3232308 RepID=UPI00366EADE0